jgi:hypothetical protein
VGFKQRPSGSPSLLFHRNTEQREMSERVSKEEKARLREDFRQLAAEVRLTEEEGAAANPALIGQLIRKNDELYSSVSNNILYYP